MSSKKPYDARLRSLKRNKLLTALMSVIVGLVLLLKPSATLSLLSKFIGIMILITGAVMLLIYLRQRESSLKIHLAASIILAVLGLWIFLRPSGLVALIPTIIGIIVMFDGIFNLGEALTIQKQSRHSPVMPVVLGIITIVLGLVLIFKPLGVAAVITQVIGIVTLYNGISDFLIAMKIHPVPRD
ncbi:MAG: HdeD family acid-resistance protein [Eubacterium sp.]